MSRKKLAPLIEAINVYNQLDERDRATFSDYVRSQQPRRPKSTQAKVCAQCGLKEVWTIHRDTSHDHYHPFVAKSTSTTALAAAKRSRRQSAPVVSTPSTDVQQASAGVAASIGGGD